MPHTSFVVGETSADGTGEVQGPDAGGPCHACHPVSGKLTVSGLIENTLHFPLLPYLPPGPFWDSLHLSALALWPGPSTRSPIVETPGPVSVV